MMPVMQYARPNIQPETFKIRVTKRLEFKTQGGEILKVYEIGDLIDATHADERGYWVTPMGGIYFEEAELA